MRPCFIIGNGPSRAVINVEKLMQYGTVWGCNALYRDFSPHFLVVVDKKMQVEIMETNYYKEHKVFFRETPRRPPYLPEHPNITVWGQKISVPNNSGVAAIYFAMKAGHKLIYLIGFDLKTEKGCHNIYQGTKNYDVKPPKVRRNIIEKINNWTIANCNIIDFYRVYNKDLTFIPKLKGFKPPRMTNITYENFNKHYPTISL